MPASSPLICADPAALCAAARPTAVVRRMVQEAVSSGDACRVADALKEACSLLDIPTPPELEADMTFETFADIMAGLGLELRTVRLN